MNGRFQLLGLVCIALLLVVAIANQKASAPTTAAASMVVEVPEPTSPEEQQARAVAYEQLTQGHVRELARMAEDQRKRDQAAVAMKYSRDNLQAKSQSGWTELLVTNAAAFQTLRSLAARSPNGRTPCTLCDGKGYQSYCLLCPADKGRCVTCRGTGKVFVDEYCPTCLGARKCFLCYGSGKMACPFCDDGMITLDWPPPPAKMPVE